MTVKNATAVVVTFNRLPLLKKCIAALQAQTDMPTAIVVINNASTDGTGEYLDTLASRHHGNILVAHFNENRGGAGGFFEGLRLAIKNGADWVWMMDDDAEPHPNAFEELSKIAINTADIYGSLATRGNETSWLMTLQGDPPRTTSLVADVPTQAEVAMLPFLGFLIHRDLVQRIGLPDPGFFIAADDVEYCVRARRIGARIFVAGNSHIEHPKSRPYKVKWLGCTLTTLELPPWKRYYDTRNRLLIARKHYGSRLFTQTIPGSLVRMCATLIREPQKTAQLKAFAAGFIDGLLGRKGNRHEAWGIRK